MSLSLTKTIKAHPAVGWVRADQPASVQILNELNETRKRNQELQDRIEELQDEVQALSPAPAVENLAGLDDSFELHGKYRHRGDATETKLKVTWGQLFAAIAPRVQGNPNNELMRSHFGVETETLYKANRPNLSGVLVRQ